MQSYFYIERGVTGSFVVSASQNNRSIFSGTTAANANNIYSSSNGDLTWNTGSHQININKSGHYLFSFVAYHSIFPAAGDKDLDGFFNLYVNSQVSQSKPFAAIKSENNNSADGSGRDTDYCHFIQYVDSGSTVTISYDTSSVAGAPQGAEISTWQLDFHPGTSLVAIKLDNAFAYQQVKEINTASNIFVTGTEFNFFQQATTSSITSSLWTVATGSATSSVTAPHLFIFDMMVGVSGSATGLGGTGDRFGALSKSVLGTNLLSKIYKNGNLVNSVSGTAFQGIVSGAVYSEPDMARGFYIDNTSVNDAFRIGLLPAAYTPMQLYPSSSFSAIQIPNYSKAYSITVTANSAYQTRTASVWSDSLFSSSLYTDGTASLTQSVGSTIVTYNTSSGNFTINEAGVYQIMQNHVLIPSSALADNPSSGTTRSFYSWIQISGAAGLRYINSGSAGKSQVQRRNIGGTPVWDHSINRFQTTNQAIMSLSVGDVITPLMSASWYANQPTASYISAVGTSLTIIQLGAVTVAPTITITSPTSAATYTTTTSSITLTGSQTDSTAVTWNNYNNSTSGSATFDSTTFTISSISLVSGSNNIAVSASNGIGTTTDSITVSYTPLPSFTITSHQTGSIINTDSSSVTVSGTHNYATAIYYANVPAYTGTPNLYGTASIVGSNFTAGPISLLSGLNVVILQASNSAGVSTLNSVSSAVYFNYTPTSNTCSTTYANLPQPIGSDYTINLYKNNNTQVTKFSVSGNCPQLPFALSTPGPISLRGRSSAPKITSGD